MQGGDSATQKDGYLVGYKLHLISSTGSIVVPLSADVTTANVYDNQMYESMTSCLPRGVNMHLAILDMMIKNYMI